MELVDIEYNSAARQNRIISHIRSLRMNRFIRDNCTLTDTLEIFHDNETKMFSQRPKHQIKEDNRIEYLQNSEIAQFWAPYACSNVSSGQLQHFYRQLESAI